MPLYGVFTLPSALYPGDSFNSINNEASSLYPSGTGGERVALAMTQDGSERDISLAVVFSANPGTFEVDVQTADQDVAGAYQTVTSATITTASVGPDGKYYARYEVHVKAKFARPYVKTQTANAVNITATITG